MDLGDLFLFTNYHHVLGKGVDLEGIIRRNLSTTTIPSKIISTRNVFERVSAQNDEQIVKQCPSTSDNIGTPAEIKQNPDQNEHPNTRTKTNDPFNKQIEIIKPNSVSCNTMLRKNTFTESEKGSSCAVHMGELSEITQDGRNEKSAVTSALTGELNKSNLIDQTELVCVEQTTTKECSCGESFHSHVFSEQEKRTYEMIIDILVKAQHSFLSTPVDQPASAKHNQKFSTMNPHFEEISEEATTEERNALTQILHLIQSIIKAVVIFSKHIPGFSDLSVNDRLILKKASKSESHLLGSVLMDTQNKSLQITNDKKMSFEELGQIFAGDYLEQSFKCTDELNALHLSEREMAVVRAKIIIYPEREGLEDKDAVKKLYQQINDCLFYVLFQDQCNNIPKRLCQIDNALKTLRELTVTYNHVLENVFEESRMLNNFGLIKEFMDM